MDKHGFWKLSVKTFYCDLDSCEACYYVVAHCSNCGRKHPDKYTLYTKYVHKNNNYTSGDWSWDEVPFVFDFENIGKESTMKEFKSSYFEFAKFCPDCGSRMDSEPI